MSSINNCSCGVPGMNFRPPDSQAAIDCFLMYKTAQVFTGHFCNLRVNIILEQVISPLSVVPVPPFSFVAARSFNAPAEIISFEQGGSIMPLYSVIEDKTVVINTYHATVSAPVEIVFTDVNNIRFYARGSVALTLDIRTPLTIEQIFAHGPLTAYIEFNATSGVFRTDGIEALISGTATILSLCPALLRVRHEDECSFMSPRGEGVIVTATPAPTP